MLPMARKPTATGTKALDAMREALDLSRAALELTIDAAGGAFDDPAVVAALKLYRDTAAQLLPYEQPKLAAIITKDLTEADPLDRFTTEQLAEIVFGPNGNGPPGRPRKPKVIRGDGALAAVAGGASRKDH